MFADLVVEDCDLTSPDLVEKQEIARVALGRHDNKKKQPGAQQQEMVYDDDEPLEKIDELEGQEESSVSKNMSFDTKDIQKECVPMGQTLTSTAEAPREFTMQKVEQTEVPVLDQTQLDDDMYFLRSPSRIN